MTALPARLSTYRPVLDRIVFILALVGLLDVTHLYLQEQRGFDRGCFGVTADDPSALFDCGTVVSSAAGTFLGVSNITWGAVFYLTMALLSAALLFVRPLQLLWLKRLRAALVVFGVGYSGYLVYYQAAVLDQFCKLCLVSAGCVLLLFITILIDYVTTPKDMARMTNFKREAHLFGGLAVLAVMLMGADTLYFKQLAPADTAPIGPITLELPIDEAPATSARDAVPGTNLTFETPVPLLAGTADCSYNNDIARWDDYMSVINLNDPFLGNFDADVTVIEFFDVNCPHCRSWHPGMKEVVAANENKARFYMVPFVLGAHSVAQTSLLLMAAQEDKYFEALDLIMDRQPTLSSQSRAMAQAGYAMGQAQQNGGDVEAARATFQQEQTKLNALLKTAADELGMDGDALVTRINNNTYVPTMQSKNDKISASGISSVPTVVINGQAVASDSRTVDCVTTLITQAAGS